MYFLPFWFSLVSYDPQQPGMSTLEDVIEGKDYSFPAEV